MTRILLAVLVVTLALTACVAPAVPAQPVVSTSIPATEVATMTPAPLPAVTPIPEPMSTSQPSETVAPPSTADCPTPSESTRLYTSDAEGWCFLYPAALTLQETSPRPHEATFVSAPLDPAAMESMVVRLTASANGPADGMNSGQYASAWLDLNMPGRDPLEKFIDINGQKAAVLDNLPGYAPEQGAFIVANDRRYQITLSPQIADAGEMAKLAQETWDTVTQSLVFFPPQANYSIIRPQDVCPSASGDATLHTNLNDGFCLLLPAGFAVDPNFTQRFIGGPEMGPVEGFDSVRPSLAVAPFAIGGQTEAALTPISDQIDPASVVSTTIAGNPAVVYDFTGGPWRQRGAQILVGDSIYTIVAQPWDEAKFPQGIADIERLWKSVVDSLAFFTPWR